MCRIVVHPLVEGTMSRRNLLQEIRHGRSLGLSNVSRCRLQRSETAMIPIFEPFEQRRMLSASVFDGTLVVVGSKHGDSICVGMDSDSGKLVLEVNGRSRSFDPAAISGVKIYGGNGSDDIEVDSPETFDIPVSMYGE